MATRLELYSNRDGDDKKKEKDVQFEHGYRLGFTDVNKVECLGVLKELWGPRALGDTAKGETFSSRLVTEEMGLANTDSSQCLWARLWQMLLHWRLRTQLSVFIRLTPPIPKNLRTKTFI